VECINALLLLLSQSTQAAVADYVDDDAQTSK